MIETEHTRAHGDDLTTVIASLGYAYPSERVDNEAYFSRARFPLPDREALVAETRIKSCSSQSCQSGICKLSELAALASLRRTGRSPAVADVASGG